MSNTIYNALISCGFLSGFGLYSPSEELEHVFAHLEYIFQCSNKNEKHILKFEELQTLLNSLYMYENNYVSTGISNESQAITQINKLRTAFHAISFDITVKDIEGPCPFAEITKLQEVSSKVINESKPLNPKIAKIINDNFWDLLL